MTSLCQNLDKLGVPQLAKWRSLILYMRGMEDNETLSLEQKALLQSTVLQALEAGDFSPEAYCKLSRRKEEILSKPWRERLASALAETAKVLDDYAEVAAERMGEVKDLERQTVAILHEETDLPSAIDRIHRTFESTIARLEADNQRLVELSTKDPLTGLANRRAIDEFLEREMAACRTKRIPFGLIMADIDHFKAFNDTYGHQVGDQALIKVATLLREIEAKKPSTNGNAGLLAGRYGGEEFLLALPGYDMEASMDLAEDLRRRVESYAFELRDEDGTVSKSDITLTVSLGVAEAAELGVGLADELLRRADIALYEAKNHGRNRVRFADRR